VFPSISLAHTNPWIFPEPYSFRPERFLEGGGETYSWIPFGGGTRRCIGAAFAQLEMKVVLRTVLRAADLRAVSPEPQPMIRRNVTLSPRDGTPVTMSRRTVPAATGREGAPSPT
jgi:cytochrome P450